MTEFERATLRGGPWDGEHATVVSGVEYVEFMDVKERDRLPDLESREDTFTAVVLRYHRRRRSSVFWLHDDEAAQEKELSMLRQGDYVLATKWRDGDPADQFAIGFYDRFEDGRHYVVDGVGEQFRGNGFRRCEPISQRLGEKLLRQAEEMESAALNGAYISLWDIVDQSRG